MVLSSVTVLKKNIIKKKSQNINKPQNYGNLEESSRIWKNFKSQMYLIVQHMLNQFKSICVYHQKIICNIY